MMYFNQRQTEGAESKLFYQLFVLRLIESIQSSNVRNDYFLWWHINSVKYLVLSQIKILTLQRGWVVHPNWNDIQSNTKHEISCSLKARFTSFVQRFQNLYESVIIFCFALFSFETVVYLCYCKVIFYNKKPLVVSGPPVSIFRK